MKVFINQNGGYNIKGSVWKYQLGNNITPLELPAYEEAIKDLNSLTFGTYMESKVISYEFGLNIKTTHAPLHYMMQLVSSKLNNRSIDFSPQFSNGNLWCMRSTGIERYIKFYDKTCEAKLLTNLLRIEYVVKSPKRILRANITVKDTLSESFIHYNCDILRQFTENMIFKADYDPAYLGSLKPRDMWRYLAYMMSKQHNPRLLISTLGLDPVSKSREYKHLKRVIGAHTEGELKKEICEKVNQAL
ncbi:MAG TPA: hypothetical protein PLO70_02755, partial [Chitinophagaceae bacterium]|nr:hypothetical protein [Chitinophagaceae bacterium]